MIDWQFVARIFPKLAAGAALTLAITCASFALAVLGGFVVLWLQRSKLALVSGTTVLLSDFIRSTPLLIQIFVVYFVAPAYGIYLSPISTGIFVLSVHYSCYMAEVYRGALNSVGPGQWEAAAALGLGPMQTFRKIILPQMYSIIIPGCGTYLIYMFKDTPVLSAITVRELLQVSSRIGADNFRYLEPITIVGILFLAMSLGASALLRWAEKRTSYPKA